MSAITGYVYVIEQFEPAPVVFKDQRLIITGDDYKVVDSSGKTISTGKVRSYKPNEPKAA